MNKYDFFTEYMENLFEMIDRGQADLCCECCPLRDKCRADTENGDEDDCFDYLKKMLDK